MHTFHIPVLGLSYSVDTPVKVARFGISSVVSIIEDDLIEKMRAYHCAKAGLLYTAITVKENDYRAKRITAYLDLLADMVDGQVVQLRAGAFEAGSDTAKYFELLPDGCASAILYRTMNALPDGAEKHRLQEQLRDLITAGAIDVNIMAKVDNLAYAADGTQLPVEYSDALSAFRGFANSKLSSSVVLSAGYNPRLYSYVETFPDFLPDANDTLKKKVILKVSDYRSALVQGKLMAKKGIWISEFRIESGLNCGGHAFATDGLLLGPILEEFKYKRDELRQELFELCNRVLQAKGAPTFAKPPAMRITVQGGIGTAHEDEFLRSYYCLDGTGWGSPFLLVPEATNVDDQTLHQLATAEKSDYHLSDASPLGVPFHNFKNSSSERQRLERFEKGRPGSPCYKKFLSSSTEFTDQPICTASRQYQDLKIKQLRESGLSAAHLGAAVNKVIAKDCLCEGLSAAVLLKEGIPASHNLSAVTICPGPNLAYFSGVFTLRQMVDHIYGRGNLLNKLQRPNMFGNELALYIDYLKKEIEKCGDALTQKQRNFFRTFSANLQSGIAYYTGLIPEFARDTRQLADEFMAQLKTASDTLLEMSEPAVLPG